MCNPEGNLEPVEAPKATLTNLVDGRNSEKAPWSALFTTNRQFVEAFKLEKNGKLTEPILLGSHGIDELNATWGHCYVGFVAGRFPGRNAYETLMNAWGTPCKLVIHSSGWVLFKFQFETDKMKVIGNGPYSIYCRPLILKDMSRFFTFDDKFLSIIPCWINLPGLPLECWNSRSLSKIASAVGMPIAMDRLTAERERISYARVLVEVDTSGPIVESVQIHLPNVDILKQPVTFETILKFCTKCKRVGHCMEDCKTVMQSQELLKRTRRRSRSRPARRSTEPTKTIKTNTSNIPSSSGTKDVEASRPQFAARRNMHNENAGGGNIISKDTLVESLLQNSVSVLSGACSEKVVAYSVGFGVF